MPPAGLASNKGSTSTLARGLVETAPQAGESLPIPISRTKANPTMPATQNVDPLTGQHTAAEIGRKP